MGMGMNSRNNFSCRQLHSIIQARRPDPVRELGEMWCQVASVGVIAIGAKGEHREIHLVNILPLAKRWTADQRKSGGLEGLSEIDAGGRGLLEQMAQVRERL